MSIDWANDPASAADAMAGWAQNPNAPVDQRLAAAKQALDYYVDQADRIDGKLDDLATAHATELQAVRLATYETVMRELAVEVELVEFARDGAIVWIERTTYNDLQKYLPEEPV